MKGSLLALDTGSRTGHTVVNEYGGCRTGVWDLGKNTDKAHPDPRVVKLEELVTFEVATHDVRYVVYEDPLIHNRSSAQAALARAMVTAVELVAHRAGAQVKVVHTATLKKHATGSGHAKKPHMIGAAWERWPLDRDKWVMVEPKKAWIRDPELVCQFTAIPHAPGLVPDDNQVDSVWAANWGLQAFGLEPKPEAWRPCACCPDYWCMRHLLHAHDCPCPPIEEWETDPYIRELRKVKKRKKGPLAKKARARKAGEAPYSWGYDQTEMFA